VPQFDIVKKKMRTGRRIARRVSGVVLARMEVACSRMGWGREAWREVADEVRCERSDAGKLLYSGCTNEVSSVRDSLTSEEATLA
jgi:hypothetical protein